MTSYNRLITDDKNEVVNHQDNAMADPKFLHASLHTCYQLGASTLYSTTS